MRTGFILVPNRILNRLLFDIAPVNSSWPARWQVLRFRFLLSYNLRFVMCLRSARPLAVIFTGSSQFSSGPQSICCPLLYFARPVGVRFYSRKLFSHLRGINAVFALSGNSDKRRRHENDHKMRNLGFKEIHSRNKILVRGNKFQLRTVWTASNPNAYEKQA